MCNKWTATITTTTTTIAATIMATRKGARETLGHLLHLPIPKLKRFGQLFAKCTVF